MAMLLLRNNAPRGKIITTNGKQVRESVTEALKVEKALARLHGIKPENEQAFHARIGHLKKLGAVPSASRGKRLSYTLADIETLAFCTALAEFRLDPSIIRDFVNIYRGHIHETFEQVRQEKRTYGVTKKAQVIYLTFAARFLADTPRDEEAGDDPQMRWLQSWRADELTKAITSGQLQFWFGGRVGLINVSIIWQALTKLIPEIGELADEVAPEAVESEVMAK
jgi:hypothetical protein